MQKIIEQDYTKLSYRELVTQKGFKDLDAKYFKSSYVPMYKYNPPLILINEITIEEIRKNNITHYHKGWYNKNGRILRVEFIEDGKFDGANMYEYDIKNRLIKIIHIDKDEKITDVKNVEVKKIFFEKLEQIFKK